MVLAPILLRLIWGDHDKCDGTRPQIEHFLFETKRFPSRVSNFAKRDDFLMSIFKRRNLAVCVFFTLVCILFASFRFLKPFCHESAFSKTAFYTRPLILYEAGLWMCMLRFNKASVWNAGAVPQVTCLALLDCRSQPSCHTPPPLINIRCLRPEIPSIQNSRILYKLQYTVIININVYHNFIKLWSSNLYVKNGPIFTAWGLGAVCWLSQ